MQNKCKECDEIRELRLGTCWDCATMESIIVDGTDMYELGFNKETDHPAKTGMEKLRLLRERGYLK